MYRTNSQVIFVIHILYISRLIDVKAPHRKTEPVRSGKNKINDVNAPYNREPGSCGQKLKRLKCIDADNIKSCCVCILLTPFLLLIGILLSLFLFNPGLLLSFFTPLPYVAFICKKQNSDSTIWKDSLKIWLVFSCLATIGGVGYVVYGILLYQDHGIVFGACFGCFIIFSIKPTIVQVNAIANM